WSGPRRCGPAYEPMHKIWAIVRREFVERVRTRWFWIGALLGPVLFGVVFFLSGQLGRGGGPKRIAIVDATATEVGARIAEQLGRGGNWAIRVPAAARVIDSLTAEVRAKRLDGFLVVTDAALDSGKVEYRGANVFAGKGALQRPVGEALTVVRLQGAGVVAASLSAAARQGPRGRGGVHFPVPDLGSGGPPLAGARGAGRGGRRGRSGRAVPDAACDRRDVRGLHGVFPGRLLSVLRDVRGGGRHVVHRAGGAPGAAAGGLDARLVVHQHVRHAERPGVAPRRDALAHPVQLTRRHARAVGGGESAGVRAGALARHLAGGDRGGDVGRGADL